MWIQGTGTLVYDPVREGMKRRTEWWAVLNIHGGNEITRYLRWLLSRQHMDAIQLDQHAWSAHISVIRGERPAPNLMHLWKKYNNKMFSFKYSTEIRHANKFWVVDVYAPELMKIRTELNLKTNYPLHITVGKDKQYD